MGDSQTLRVQPTTAGAAGKLIVCEVFTKFAVTLILVIV